MIILAEDYTKVNAKIFTFFLEYVTVNNVLLIFKCVGYNRGFENKESLGKRFEKTYRFCDGDIDKFCLMIKLFIRISTWIFDKDSMKRHC